MINRRLLRIKALQELYAYTKYDARDYRLAEKELIFSIEKTHKLYFQFLLLLVEIRNTANMKIDLMKNRHIKDDEQWQRLEILANNRVLKRIEENRFYIDFINDNKISWYNSNNLIESYYKQLVESDFYNELLKKEDSIVEDKNLLEYFITDLLGQNDFLFEYLEDRSIYWNDDIEFVAEMVLKTIRKTNDNSNKDFIFDTFKNEDDRDFIIKLFRKTAENFSFYDTIIKKNLLNWEIDRVAEMDILIVKLAINEAVEFPLIPLKVTINEYIDLAKSYSTEKSGVFINGILDRIFKQMEETREIKKIGKGIV